MKYVGRYKINEGLEALGILRGPSKVKLNPMHAWKILASQEMMDFFKVCRIIDKIEVLDFKN